MWRKRGHTTQPREEREERGERKKRRRDCKNGEMIVRCVSIDDIEGTGSSANSGEGGLVTLVTIVTLVLGRSQELQASNSWGGLAGFFLVFWLFYVSLFFALRIGESKSMIFIGPQELILISCEGNNSRGQAFWIGRNSFFFFFFVFFFTHKIFLHDPKNRKTLK